MNANDININLADPESIKERLPEVEQIADAKRKEAESWDALANDLARIAGIERRKKPSPIRAGGGGIVKAKASRKPSTKDHVVRIVTEAARPLNIGEVTHVLSQQQGRPANRETVGWSLWKAGEESLLQSLSKGMYAPADYPVDDANLLASRNGSEAEEADEA